MPEIRSNVELPRIVEPITLHTTDGLSLVGELSLPKDKPPVATLACFHPLPTQGGFMDSHIIRKAAWRLPYLADLAVFRFNTRGTESPHGKSQGVYDYGRSERFDVAAVASFLADRGLPNIWYLGWSFGTELVLKYSLDYPAEGAILLSPPLHITSEDELARWHGSGRPLIAIVPERDDYLQPPEARKRFGAVVPECQVIDVPDGRHLWLGEKQSRIVLNHIVSFVNPSAVPLPTEYPENLE